MNIELKEIIIEALSTLKLNKLRTGLAVLGIVIGIGSVIALVSLGQGSQKAIENQIQSLGSNLLTVIPGGGNSGGVRGASGSSTTLTQSDGEAIKSEISSDLVTGVSPEMSSRAQVIAGTNNTNTSILGVEPIYATVHKIAVDTGSFISEEDVTSFSKVAVLGSTAASELFDGADAVGQTIKIDNQLLTVIGIAASKGGAGFNNPDDSIYVPLSVASKLLFGRDNLSTISVEAASDKTMVEAQDAIGYLLLSRHHLDSPSQADFSILSQSDILSTASSVTSTFTTLLGGIAAISLLVGGIGIMNIMLVTVTERTREIGLRKALGATYKIIITQFLVEAVILTLTGGLVGTILGISISWLLSSYMSIPLTISFSSVSMAVIVSGAIGIIFGYFPARTAGRLEPIEALRYE